MDPTSTLDAINPDLNRSNLKLQRRFAVVTLQTLSLSTCPPEDPADDADLDMATFPVQAEGGCEKIAQAAVTSGVYAQPFPIT